MRMSMNTMHLCMVYTRKRGAIRSSSADVRRARAVPEAHCSSVSSGTLRCRLTTTNPSVPWRQEAGADWEVVGVAHAAGPARRVALVRGRVPVQVPRPRGSLQQAVLARWQEAVQALRAGETKRNPGGQNLESGPDFGRGYGCHGLPNPRFLPLRSLNIYRFIFLC
jgi:hypothetical protein